jgi:hypothetical protein
MNFTRTLHFLHFSHYFFLYLFNNLYTCASSAKLHILDREQDESYTAPKIVHLMIFFLQMHRSVIMVTVTHPLLVLGPGEHPVHHGIHVSHLHGRPVQEEHSSDCFVRIRPCTRPPHLFRFQVVKHALWTAKPPFKGKVNYRNLNKQELRI